MLSLVDGGASRPGWSGRILAGAGLLVAGSALLAHLAVCRVSDRRPGWTARPAVTGRDARTKALHLTPLRCAQPGAGRADRAWALLAGLLDVASGRRSWFGMRARSPGQWYALRPEWQDMLSDRAVGLLHAPAWTDEPSLQLEACAAADVYATVVPAARRLAVAFGAAWHWRSGSSPGVARTAAATRQ